MQRYDEHYKETVFDAVACNVNQFYSLNETYGRQYGDLLLRSIGISMSKLVRKTGGIGCRKEGDTFLLYLPHQDDMEQLLRKFSDDLFVDEETAGKVTLRFGVYVNARQERDIEERFACAKSAADSIEHDPQSICGFYLSE